MLFRKCEKKGHPIVAVLVGALAIVGAFTVKKSGMQFIKEKWQCMCSFFKNMPSISSMTGTDTEGSN